MGPGLNPAIVPNLGPRQVGERLGITYKQAFILLQRGGLRSVNLGAAGRRYYRTSEAWLAEWLAAGGIPASTPTATATPTATEG